MFTETYDLLPYNWGLADAGPDPEHSLVTSHEVSEDGLEYIFHLREGVKWSDGEDFTADDYVFSYEAVKNATSANVLAGYVTSMESIEKIDDYTVRYTLKRPDARVLSAYVLALPGAHLGRRAARRAVAVRPVLPDGRQRPVRDRLGRRPRPERHHDPHAEPVLLGRARQDRADPDDQVRTRRRASCATSS